MAQIHGHAVGALADDEAFGNILGDVHDVPAFFGCGEVLSRKVRLAGVIEVEHADDAVLADDRARAQMQAEERKADRPNIIKGTLPPTGTWRPVTALYNRGTGRLR